MKSSGLERVSGPVVFLDTPFRASRSAIIWGERQLIRSIGGTGETLRPRIENFRTRLSGKVLAMPGLGRAKRGDQFAQTKTTSACNCAWWPSSLLRPCACALSRSRPDRTLARAVSHPALNPPQSFNKKAAPANPEHSPFPFGRFGAPSGDRTRVYRFCRPAR
jgi:hypothetical protein